ncbi:MAG TPA: DUF2624 domain-containing protein [Chondromyces sp.]|nr:DUF2624 domain-containing protein [Chondromyces sp.]
MKLLHSLINQKAASITGDELLKYAKSFNFDLTPQEAEKVAAYLRKKKVNLFDAAERTQLIKDLAILTSYKTAKQINQVFSLFSK